MTARFCLCPVVRSAFFSVFVGEKLFYLRHSSIDIWLRCTFDGRTGQGVPDNEAGCGSTDADLKSSITAAGARPIASDIILAAICELHQCPQLKGNHLDRQNARSGACNQDQRTHKAMSSCWPAASVAD